MISLTSKEPRLPSARATQVVEHCCRACGNAGPREFYEVGNVPTQSSSVLESRDAALSCPRADLRLVFCESCGFIGSRALPTRVTHTPVAVAETSQGFSPTFGAFARGIAQELVDRFSLRGGTVLEIGCGDGEFLSLLCELGVGHAIGVDPECRSGLIPSPPGAKLELHRALFDGSQARDGIDLILCRHTLEHIPDVAVFLRMLRRAIGGSSSTAVCFEVPDVLRSLREGAFWDFYHEHCSYFSWHSMPRAFSEAGFEVTDVCNVFGGQYLFLTARPGLGEGPDRPRGDGDLDECRRAVALFQSESRASIDRWRGDLQGWRRDGKRVVLWGSGSKAVGFLSTLAVEDEIQHVVDVNPRRHGRFMPGCQQPIISPSCVAGIRPDVLIVMNSAYFGEVSHELRVLGISPQLIVL